ncbi:uncharacterized protein LOC107849233 [Capsicum annuum]|uniref:uncharacterized protein LOC107849233 n=1 Tax=Capsicum annuum TaxID=4072 RepID=UPI0007BF76C1|nr:uncharacterized protein LOC107849233 [Capsicum annuum]
MVDRSVKRLEGILHDVLVKVANFIFPEDFVILGCEVDFEVPIILGKPFLETRRVLVDIEMNEMKFRLNDKEVSFDVCQSMKQPREMSVVSVIDVDCKDELVDQKGKGKRKRTSRPPDPVGEFFTPPTKAMDTSVEPNATVDILPTDDAASQSVIYDTSV